MRGCVLPAMAVVAARCGYSFIFTVEAEMML